MSEANSRRTVVDNFRALGADCQRIEDSLSVGVPDLNLCFMGAEAWVEFKHVEEHKLPKRGTTPVRIGLKPEQALWLNTRAYAGGNVVILTKIEPRTWMIHTAGSANMLRDGTPMGMLRATASMLWDGDFKPRAREVLKLLTGK